MRSVVYTCQIGGRDWIHGPRVIPHGVDFLRFADRKPFRLKGWQHRALTEAPGARTARIVSRFPKLRPHDTLQGYDIAVWIDGSVEVIGDLTPLLQAFARSQANVGFFPHPSGRTVAEELDFAMKTSRIPADMHETAIRQRARYAAAGTLECRIVEATIIFYRLPNAALRKAGEAWWQEVTIYTERDQVSQPYAMQDGSLDIHLWDWHFAEDNPFFRRHPHRPKTLRARLKKGAYHLGDSRLDYRLAGYAIQIAGAIKRKAFRPRP